MNPIEDKNFLEFLGKPLLLHQIGQLRKAGFDDFIVIGGAHNLARIEEVLKSEQGVKFAVVEQKELDEGMAGAVLAAADNIDGEDLLVVSGNDVVEAIAFELVKKGINDEIDGLMLAKKVESYFPGGYLVTEGDFVKGIMEKPGEGKEPSDLVNLVVHYFKNGGNLVEKLRASNSDRDDRYEKALDALIQDGSKIKAVSYEGMWQPVKFPWHVLDLMNRFLANLSEDECMASINRNKANIAESAVIKGKVFLEDGVKVFEHATVSGPCYIGKNSIVASNALVRDSHIGMDCVVGYSTEIARSYLGNVVWTHTNYVGDSVIGNNCSFGSGTVTGNLRLDEKDIMVQINGDKVSCGRNKFGLITGNDVRCGINTSLMPGVKVGNNSIIGAGIVVAENVPDSKFVYAKTELSMKDNNAQISSANREKLHNKLKS